MKLKWKVQAEATGRYRSFHKRGWPSATNLDGDAIINLYCEDDYRPHSVKTGEHAEIFISIADYTCDRKTEGYFKWRKLKKTAKTLAEAKTIAQEFVDSHEKLFTRT